MGALQNAVTFYRSEEFKDVIMAGMLYRASEIFNTPALNGTPTRALADLILDNPAAVWDRFVSLCAASVEIASPYTTVAAIPDSVVISKITAVWNTIAGSYFDSGQ